MQQTGLRYVRVLTDGTEWNCYDLVDGHLRLVFEPLVLENTAADYNRLVVWLEGVLATTQGISPTTQNIEQRLGAEGSAYKLDRATLANLYEHHREETMQAAIDKAVDVFVAAVRVNDRTLSQMRQTRRRRWIAGRRRQSRNPRLCLAERGHDEIRAELRLDFAGTPRHVLAVAAVQQDMHRFLGWPRAAPDPL